MTLIEQVSIEVVPRQALTAAKERDILALCFQAWGDEFVQLWPTFTGTTHVIAALHGRIVSHAMWVIRWLQPEGESLLQTAYVEAVVTDEALQGQGIGTAVMERLQATIATFDIGGLSPARYTFYERLGWEMWRGPRSVRTDAGLVPMPDEELMILRLPRTPKLNLDTSISIEWREGEVY